MAWTYTRITPKVDESSNKYFGIVTAPPASGMIQGDSIVIRSGESLTIKVYDGGLWKTLAESSLTSAEKSVICSKCQKDVMENIEAGTVTASEYAYFKTAIVDVLSVGDIYLSGNLHSDALETTDAQQAQTLTWISEPYNGRHYLNIQNLRDTLITEGTYFASSGTISSRYNGVTKTFTATIDDPIMIIWTSDSVRIQNSKGTTVTPNFGVTFSNSSSRRNGYFASDSEIVSNNLKTALSKGMTFCRSLMPKSDSSLAQNPVLGNHIGDPNLPFDSLWLGSYFYHYNYGHFTLSNGLEVKYGKTSVPIVNSTSTYYTESFNRVSSDGNILYYGGSFKKLGLFCLAGNCPNANVHVHATVSNDSISINAYQSGATGNSYTTVSWIAFGYDYTFSS